MKTHTIRTIFILIAIVLFGGVCAQAQDDALNQQLAKRIVRSAGVKAGDAVIIDGGRHMIPLMESVAIEVQMIGGMPTMFLGTDGSPGRSSRMSPTNILSRYRLILASG